MTAKWGAAAAGNRRDRRIRRRPADRPADLATQKEKLTYGFGIAMARTFQRAADIDVEVVAQGCP